MSDGDDSSPRLPPGAEVADYRILGTLGIGGSGTVYRAQKKDSELVVALKVMNAEHLEDDSERQRFQREAEVVKRLAHPHVVGLLDYGYADRLPYLVFPLLDGRTLEERIAKEGALGWSLTGRFSEQVLSALEVAHGMGIAHRDIKPANLFLCAGPEGESIQILDFGTAKIVGKKAQKMDVTRAGLLVGTPRYMAPEQVRMEELTPAADVYAFGLVMAEMMVGRPLVDGKAEFDIFVAQGSDNPHVIPEEILASPFATVIERAVAKPLEVRYRLASQMLADVRAILTRFGAGHAGPGEADMEATQFIVAPEPIEPNENAMKLRKAFNAIADKNAAAAPKAPALPVPPPPAPPPPTALAPQVAWQAPVASIAWSAPEPAMSPQAPMIASPLPPMTQPVNGWNAPQARASSAPPGNLPPTTMRMSIPHTPAPPAELQTPPGQWPIPAGASAFRSLQPPYPQGPPVSALPPAPQAQFVPAALATRRQPSSRLALFLVALIGFIALGAGLALWFRRH